MYTWNHTPEINISEVGGGNGGKWANIDETGIEKMLFVEAKGWGHGVQYANLLLHLFFHNFKRWKRFW